MTRSTLIPAALLAALAGAPRAAAAAPDARPDAYAIVIGSNAGGAGQESLRYAEEDARRMAALLRELGGYESGKVLLVLRPAPAALLSAIDVVRARLQADADAGRPAMLFFYYSGHARADALNLGADEVALASLRRKLEELPSALTIVVLDACQSGSFSRIKGVEPAASFSFNSLSALAQTGMAVLASSSGAELSQESERLGGSYFTHHLLVALRGAGDADRDGQVTLDEAYRYAYNQTLVATAATAIGKQHVTLEVDLKGKGAVALTWPARADAHLELPAALRGDVLLQQQPSGTVVAEVHKAPGRAVDLAVAGGRYQALWSDGKQARRCDLVVAHGGQAALDIGAPGCRTVDVQAELAKGPGGAAPPARWSIEVGAGALFPRDDGFVDRLADFGYTEKWQVIDGQLSLAVAWEKTDRLAVVAELQRMDGRTYQRDSQPSYQEYRFGTAGLTLSARASYPLARGILVPFAQAGAG
ncbi:MAG TPA: caspase family protein, partial [Kofleriaceae bacterium]|nr:caspase family protein [Kofleriaceae bacterium]